MAREVWNLATLAEYVNDLAEKWGDEYRFTPELVQTCNLLAMEGIYACAGQYRTRFIHAGDFVGAPHKDIPRLVEEMCQYVNSCIDDPFHAAAYVLWRTSWIHPFYDGNGRVSRELCYLAIVVGLGYLSLEDWNPIPISRLLKQETERYMQGLRAADLSRNDDRPCVDQLEMLLCELSVEEYP